EEAGALLRQLRGNLPNIQALRSEINNAVEMRASTQLNLILWQDRLRSVRQQAPPSVPREIVDQEPDDAAGDILDEVPLEEGIRDHRLGLLSDLIEAGQAQSDRLNEKEVRLSETLREAQSLRNTLDRRLLWLPSNVSPLRNWLPSVLSSFEWITSPELRVSVWENYRDALGQSPLLIALTALLFCVAIYARRHLRESLIDLNGAVGKIARDKYSTTPAALLVSVGLASPIPILLAGLSLPIFLFDSQSIALKAFGAGVTSLAGLLLLIRIAAIISAEDSLLSTHFNWSSRALAAIRSVPSWLLIVLCVLASIVIAALVSGRADTQDGIGSLAFIFASALVSLLGYKTFGLERGVVRQIVSEDVGNGPLFLGFFTFAIAPLIVGALPLLGYFDTAVALQSRVLASATLLFVAALLFGILNRILLIAQRRLALRRAIERRERKAAERAEREQLGEGDDEEDFIEPSATTEELQRERQLISSQTERLLFYVFGIGILIGLFGIWATVLPALGVANDITLWTGVDTIDGVRTARPVTLWNLFLFFAFNIGGVFAAYNIRGILEVGVFQRLHLSAGSRYAIQTIIGYFFVGTGIIAGFLQLGVDWSRLQWIIAALGVGLGFGLQEIVANFISGLIILFERPVRVGDTVNIGELEGDVTNIAIRATTVRDFDNREVLLPNKSIITENVTNWTLRDSVVRIIINIGVAYGSDIEAVREILLRIADDENDVLETPEPRAFFMNHGDSSLDFELRVFISNPRKRFRVRDELNTAINKAFKEAGIEIPFPQRDLHIRSQ
ncbi:MAG: mechanosensitive ion channel domain-containing protein, partial [Pseudomonadota bacterium]